MKLPIAETFHSIQGEGYWVGTPMFFIRLAGCSVGKPNQFMGVEKAVQGVATFDDISAPTLPSGKKAWLCHRWDNTPFWCDTDFNKYSEVDFDDLIPYIWENHVCITGGEPLIHKEVINYLLEWGTESGTVIHIETSGTILPFWDDMDVEEPWITVSPKAGYLPETIMRANEVKLLVDIHHDFKIPRTFDHSQVWLSPVNDIGGLNDDYSKDNLEYALKILQDHPNWRLSVQLHKYLGLR